MSYLLHLSKDKYLKKVLKGQEPLVLVKRKKVYLHLCASIISQQLSTQVAAVIYHRFLTLYGRKHPTPLQVLETPFEILKGVGLSTAKTYYVQNVCRFFLEEQLTDKMLYQMQAAEVLARLTQIKGVGKWTAEMILMFSLQHEDVFPADDLGIQQAMIHLYGIKPKNKKELLIQMHQIAEKWRPYRTYACMHLWRWKDKP